MAKPKDTPKVMDVVHPSGTRRPSPTSRPVVLSNHAYMADDPMLSVVGTANEDAVLPVSGEKDVQTLSGAPELSTANKAANSASEPTAADIKPGEQQAADGPSLGESETSENSDTLETPETPDTAKDSLSDSAEVSTKPADLTAAVPVVAPEAAEAEAEPDSDTDEDEPEAETDTALSVDPLQAQQPQSPDEVALKAREDELEHLIAAGTYAVPINTVKQRQARVVLIILLVVFVALVAVDLLADMNIITLLFGLPHTNFLAH